MSMSFFRSRADALPVELHEDDSSERRPRRRSGARRANTLFVLMLAVAAYGGAQWGPYPLTRLRAMQRAHVREVADTLHWVRRIDSLTRYERRLTSDRALQERIARERYGLVRDDELLYRLPEDEARTAPDVTPVAPVGPRAGGEDSTWTTSAVATAAVARGGAVARGQTSAWTRRWGHRLATVRSLVAGRRAQPADSTSSTPPRAADAR